MRLGGSAGDLVHSAKLGGGVGGRTWFSEPILRSVLWSVQVKL